jgi:hypothetical protein
VNRIARSPVSLPTLAAGLGVLVVVCTAAWVPMAFASHTSLAGAFIGFAGTQAAVTLTYAGVGVVVARREPRNPIGWLLIGVGLAVSVGLVDGEQYSYLVYRRGYHGLPLGQLALLLGQCWVVALFLPPLAILVFPDGRVQSRRWRWAVRVYLAATGLLLADQLTVGVSAIVEHRVRMDSNGALTSRAPDFLSNGLVSALGALLLLVVLACWIAFVGRLVANFRRATGDHRQQLKWAMCGSAITAACIPGIVLSGASSNVERVLGGLMVLGIGALPVAMGVGIFKYRLYGIDVIIRKTLVYTALIGSLAVVYLGGIYLIDRAFQALTGQSGALAVTLSTLGVAAAFQPLRSRLQRAVDHRFYRQRYDAAKTLEAFAARLRDQIELDALSADVLGVVCDTLQPRHVSLWLRPGLAGQAGQNERPGWTSPGEPASADTGW